MIMRLVIADLVNCLKVIRIRCNLKVRSVVVRLEVSRFENKLRILCIERHLRKCVLPEGVVLFIDRKLWLSWPWSVKITPDYWDILRTQKR